MNRKNPVVTIFIIVGSLAGWFAVVFQLYLSMANRTVPPLDALIRFFSYFTILTNILVALCFSVLWLKPENRWGVFFSKPATLTATAVYIAVVGLIYNLVLRQLWSPQGLQRLVDELLHSFMPVLFVVFWLWFVPKQGLSWKGVFPWLWFPLGYLTYILVRGALSGQYPYPFMDVTKLGYPSVLVNSAWVTLAFLGFSFLFVAIAKVSERAVVSNK